MGYRGRKSSQAERDDQDIRKKRQANREKMEPVKSFRLIEHSIILNPTTMKMLKEIAYERGNAFTYSQTVAFLVKYYYDTEKANQWRHDHPLE